MIAHQPVGAEQHLALDSAQASLVRLEHYASSVRAAHVSLWRMQRLHRSLVAIAVHGIPFVGPGMEVATNIEADAAKPPSELLRSIDPADPLAALARASAIDDLQALPVPRGDGDLAAVLVVGWTEAAPAPPESEILCRFAEALPGLHALMAPRADPVGGVVVLHHQELVGHGIARALEASCGLAVIACAVDELEPALAHDQPWVVICSDHLEDLASPSEIASRARGLHPAARMIVLANATTPASVTAARTADADGYATFEDGLEQLIDVLEAVLAGERVPLPSPQGADLTRREFEILNGLEEGLTYHEIAVRQGVTLSTVKSQSRPLFRKLNATSRASAVHRARKDGLL